MKNYVIGFLAAFCFILTVNTIFKTHICEHESPIPPDELIELDAEKIQRFKKSLSFATVSNDDNIGTDFGPYREFWDFTIAAYPEIFDNEKFEVKIIDEFTVMLRTHGLDRSLKPGLFIAHVDVVPAVRDQWNSEPFQPIIENRYIQARGTMDCKGQLFGHLEAIKTMVERNIEFERDCFWFFAHDEEIGGAVAVKTAKIFENEYGIEENGFAFIVDEGNPAVKDVLPGIKEFFLPVGYTAKGQARVRLDVHFEGAGHGSIPGRESAITILNKALSVVSNNPQPSQFGRSLEYPMFEKMAPHMPFPGNIILSNLWLFGPVISRVAGFSNMINAFVRTTTAITIVKAGYKNNVIPVEAHAIIDHRVHPGQAVSGVVEHLRRVINDDRVKITLFESKEADKETPVDSIFGQKIIRSIHRTMPGTIVVPSIFLAAADSRHLEHLSEHIFRFAPFQMTKEETLGIHGPNERISLESYKMAINFYFDFYRHLSDYLDNSNIHHEL